MKTGRAVCEGIYNRYEHRTGGVKTNIRSVNICTMGVKTGIVGFKVDILCGK